MYDPIHCGLLSGTSPHPDSPHAAPAPCDRGPGAGRIAPRCLQIAALLACSAAVLLLATPRPRSHCADETACLFASPPGAVLSRTVRGPGVALRGGGGRPHNSGSPVSIAVPTRADARAAVPVPPDPEAKGNPLEQLWGYPFWPVQLALGALMGLLGRRWWARPRRPEAPAEAPPLPPAPRADISRRQWLQGAAAGAAATATTAPAPAAAAGLITKFPPDSLNNVYLLMRSGEGQYEADGVVRHNPVLNTNLAGRLTKEGKRQAIRGMSAIKGLRIDPDTIWIWPSITARAYETGEILAQGLGVPRSRLVPEFTFLDARGFGSYEGQALDKLSEVPGRCCACVRGNGWYPGRGRSRVRGKERPKTTVTRLTSYMALGLLVRLVDAAPVGGCYTGLAPERKHATGVWQGNWFSVGLAPYQKPLSNTRPLRHLVLMDDEGEAPHPASPHSASSHESEATTVTCSTEGLQCVTPCS